MQTKRANDICFRDGRDLSLNGRPRVLNKFTNINRTKSSIKVLCRLSFKKAEEV